MVHLAEARGDQGCTAAAPNCPINGFGFHDGFDDQLPAVIQDGDQRSQSLLCVRPFRYHVAFRTMSSCSCVIRETSLSMKVFSA
jgi:hypothetical protein